MKKTTITTQVIIIVAALLLVFNVVLGALLIQQAKSSIFEMIDERILDISNSAAALIDGAVFEALTEDDIKNKTDAFRQINSILETFQDKIACDYIYTVKQVGDEFVFVIDPDTEEPAPFGSPIVYSEAMYNALTTGQSFVDKDAIADKWGQYYTSFSPIFNGNKVVGCVGVDFPKEWFDQKITRITVTVVIGCTLSMLIGGVIVALFAARVRSKLNKVHVKLGALSSGIDELTNRLSEDKDYFNSYVQNEPDKKANDEIGTISDKISNMHDTLNHYIDYMRLQAYTDKLTSVKNSTAYYSATEQLFQKIESGNANFALILFDLNGLKMINDELGHAIGDLYIMHGAKIISKVLGKDHVYRIGGDEFISLIENISEDDVKKCFEQLDQECAVFNQSGVLKADKPLSFSKGYALFDPHLDTSIKDVFTRADVNMYDDKKAFYSKHDRRSN